MELKNSQAFFFSDRSIHLHSMLLNCGHELREDHSYAWNGLQRGCGGMLVWQYTLSGRGQLRIGETHYYDLLPGTAFLVEVPQDHCYFLPEDSERWEFLYVSVSGSELLRLGRLLTGEYGCLLKHLPGSPVLHMAWDLLKSAPAIRKAGPLRASAAAYEFLLTLYAEQRAGPAQSRQNGLLERVNEYLNTHLSEEIRVEALAEHCSCSRSHFCRTFHEASGVTPREYIRDLRMRFAAHLLQTEQFSVKEISVRTGFADPSHFCRVFRRTFGMSPETFRSGGIRYER